MDRWIAILWKNVDRSSRQINLVNEVSQQPTKGGSRREETGDEQARGNGNAIDDDCEGNVRNKKEKQGGIAKGVLNGDAGIGKIERPIH
jgi:hypothetical protein